MVGKRKGAESTDSAAQRQRAGRLRSWLDTFVPPETLVTVVTAVVVGIGTGLGAVAFIWLLRQISQLRIWVQLSAGEVVGLLLVMGAAGLIVGYMVSRWAPEAKGHGVPEVMEAIAIRGGRIRPRVAALKVLASAITIGAGGSAGREGPIVQTGAALGSTLGQLLHFSAERVQTLVACGAAAGIAATFNAPIAGAIFALEVILGRFTTRYFGAVVISSVTASIVARVTLGAEPAFSVPAYPFQAAETPFYVALGIVAALMAVLFIRSLYFAEGFFDRWRMPQAIKAAIGMLATAVVALLVPGQLVLGPGLDFIGETIASDFVLPLGTLVVLLLGKLIATNFTLGSGNSGGVFAPSLYMGAVLGGILGRVANSIWPTIVINPGAYAIVGMAAVFAGAARAPITAVLIVFEMSNDYKLILPLMLATVVSTLLAEYLFADSIYTFKLRLKGIVLDRGRDMDLMQSLLVREAMTPNPNTVRAAMTLGELGYLFQETHSHSFPVVDDNENLVGMVSIRDYEQALEDGADDEAPIASIATMGNLLTAYDDEPLSDAIERLAVRGVNKMPVVSRNASSRVLGVIRRRDIVRAYNMALVRRAQKQFDAKRVRLRQVDDMEFVDCRLPENSPLAGKTLATVASELPRESVIVSIRRQGKLIVPHGDTVFQAGDLVHGFVRAQDQEEFRRCLLGAAEEPLRSS